MIVRYSTGCNNYVSAHSSASPTRGYIIVFASTVGTDEDPGTIVCVHFLAEDGCAS